MADTLKIFGDEFTNVAGIKATDDNDQTKVYIRPQGTKSITENGTGIDVTGFASVNVAVQSGVDPSNLEIAVSPLSAVGTAIVGTAETESPNYTPSGDITQTMEDVRFMTGATATLDVGFGSGTLYVYGITITPTTATKQVATSAPVFVGNGVHFVIEEDNS